MSTRRSGVFPSRGLGQAGPRNLSRHHPRVGDDWRHVDCDFVAVSKNRFVASAASRLSRCRRQLRSCRSGRDQQFNSRLDDEVIRLSRADDPDSALAEWDGLFRSDLSQFFDDVTIDAASISGGRSNSLRSRFDIPGFADASAGRHDAFCFGIGHREDGRIIADVIRGRRPPFDPATIAASSPRLPRNIDAGNHRRHFCRRVGLTAFKAAGVEYSRIGSPEIGALFGSTAVLDARRVSIPNLPILIRELLFAGASHTIAASLPCGPRASGSDDHSQCFGRHHVVASRQNV